MIKDLTGQEFGRLRVLGRGSKRKGGRPSWSCLCTCGNTVNVSGQSLKAGDTKSCGCLRQEWGRMAGRMSRKHGEGAGTPEYRTWINCRQRCGNKNHPLFPIYGGRGITVCAAWVASYEAFLKDVGRRPSDEHSLDRINVDGNYEPGNVAWATSTEQNRNKRNNHRVTIKGVTKTLAEWFEELGTPRSTYYSRRARGVEEKEALAP